MFFKAWTEVQELLTKDCVQIRPRIELVIVLTKAAPALFIKWRGEYFLK